MPAGKIDNMVTPRRDGFDFDIDAIDTPVSVHVQLRNEAASDQTDPDFRHCGCLRLAVGDLYRVPLPVGEQRRRRKNGSAMIRRYFRFGSHQANSYSVYSSKTIQLPKGKQTAPRIDG
jgi:hypothetical protein